MDIKKSYWMSKMIFSRCPTYVIFFVTARCNSKCLTCFYWKNIGKFAKEKELKLDEIKKISKKWGHIYYLTISGGEPFLRDDLVEIGTTFVKNNHVQFISIPTNGILSEKIGRMTEEMIKRCPETSFRIALSLDGIGADHDKLRGVKGNFKKLDETYKLLDKLRQKYNNFNIDATTVYSSFNKDKIKQIYEWVEKNWEIDNHVLLLARGDTRDKVSKNISIEGYKKALEFVEKKALKTGNRRKDFRLKLLRAIKLLMREIIYKTIKENKMVVPCVAGKKMVIINEEGTIYPCELLNMPMGNLRENDYDINKILSLKKSRKVISFIKKTKCHCTFECAIQNSIIYDPNQYINILKKLIRLS